MNRGKVSLADKTPELVSEWSDRNDITPEMVSYGSKLKVWWKGKCGHEWMAMIKNRSNGHGCPICSGRLIVPGINDFKSRHPELMEEWSEENVVDPATIGENSHYVVKWKCKAGHEWSTCVSSRSRGHGCAKCHILSTIKPENHLPKKKRVFLDNFTPDFIRNIPRACVLYYLSMVGEYYSLCDDEITGLPLKVFLPGKLAAVEFVIPFSDTPINHMDEWIKNDLCRKNHIKMVRLLDQWHKPYDNCICLTYSGFSLEVMNIMINKLFALINIEADIDVVRDIFDIQTFWDNSDEKKLLL